MKMKRGPKRDRCPLNDEALFKDVEEKGALGVSKDLGVDKSTVNRWLKRRRQRVASYGSDSAGPATA